MFKRVFSIRWMASARAVFLPDRPNGIPSYPAPCCPVAPPCTASNHPARCVSGFWIRHVFLQKHINTKIYVNRPVESRICEILCKPTEEQNERLTNSFSAVYQRDEKCYFSWLPNKRTTPFFLWKPFSNPFIQGMSGNGTTKPVIDKRFNTDLPTRGNLKKLFSQLPTTETTLFCFHKLYSCSACNGKKARFMKAHIALSTIIYSLYDVATPFCLWRFFWCRAWRGLIIIHLRTYLA